MILRRFTEAVAYLVEAWLWSWILFVLGFFGMVFRLLHVSSSDDPDVEAAFALIVVSVLIFIHGYFGFFEILFHGFDSFKEIEPPVVERL